MIFTSYAQNFEDVILWRSLKDVKKGFYIDVGANDPQENSVTKAFYDSGWSGINLEPVDSWFQMLQANRPRDINLKLAAGDVEGTLEMFDVIGTGLSTLEKDVAEEHARTMNFEVNTIHVKMTTLNNILAGYRDHEIHFLKIDVEGAEAAVLNGMNLKQYRPWIILVEATKPLSQELSHQSWERNILDSGYSFVYFDGLNRFYLAEEKSELSKNFITPPNCFDEFITARTRDLLSENIILKNKLAQAELELAGIKASLSWRITKPVRKAGLFIRGYKSSSKAVETK